MQEIALRRKGLGMTQAQLAERAHVSLRDVELIERYHLVDVEVAKKVYRVLDRKEKKEQDALASEIETWRRVQRTRHFLESS